MNQNKATMELVWHNCVTYKPSEDFNSELYLTDGFEVYRVVYKRDVGFLGDGICIDDTNGSRWWWADIRQTIGGFALFEKSKTCNQL